MTPLTAAVAYAEDFGWWLLPCHWRGARRKQPLVKQGFHAASNDPVQITAWWAKSPNALVGVATGASHLAVLDVDVREPNKYGPDSLDALGRSILDNTWIAHTASGGWHCYYDRGDRDIPSTSHALGLGLDVRGSTGYVIAPAPHSGYWWDPHYNPDTIALADWLIPPVPVIAPSPTKPIERVTGLSPYRCGDRARVPGNPHCSRRESAHNPPQGSVYDRHLGRRRRHPARFCPRCTDRCRLRHAVLRPAPSVDRKGNRARRRRRL